MDIYYRINPTENEVSRMFSLGTEAANRYITANRKKNRFILMILSPFKRNKMNMHL